MKTPVGAKSSTLAARRPLQQLTPNTFSDAVPAIASNQNNLSYDGTKDIKKTNSMKGQIEKDNVESIEKQFSAIKIDADGKEPRTDSNIQFLSKALEIVHLRDSAADAKSDSKNKLLANIPGDDCKHDTGTKAKVEEKDKEPQTSNALEDEKADDDTQKSHETENNLCSRGPIASDRHLHRSTPYMNQNVICSRSHQSGGGVSVCPLPVQSQQMLNHAAYPDYPVNIPPEGELQELTAEEVFLQLCSDPCIIKAVDSLDTNMCVMNVVDTNINLPSVVGNIASSYAGTFSSDEVYNSNLLDDEGYPKSPESASIQPGSVSPVNEVDFEPLGVLGQTYTEDIVSSGNRLGIPLSNHGPPSVDSGNGSPPPHFGAPSPQPDLMSTVPNIPPNILRIPSQHVSCSPPQTHLPSFLEKPYFPLATNVYPGPVHHHNDTEQVQHPRTPTPPFMPASMPQQPHPDGPRKLLPRIPEKKPAQKKFHDKLDKDRKNTSWAKVNSVSVSDLTSSDTDGDTQLMIILSNKCENFVEVVYAMVERMRKIRGSLARENKRGFTALYIASVFLPTEPLVAAYIAEALVEEGIKVSQLKYEGLPLIECIKKKGPSHQEVLKELLSLKDEESQYVFST